MKEHLFISLLPQFLLPKGGENHERIIYNLHRSYCTFIESIRILVMMN